MAIEHLYISNRQPAMSRWVNEDDAVARMIFARSGWIVTETREVQEKKVGPRLDAYARLVLVNKQIDAFRGDLSEMGPLLAHRNQIQREIQKIESEAHKAAIARGDKPKGRGAVPITPAEKPEPEYLAPTDAEIATAEAEGDAPKRTARPRKPGPKRGA